MTLRTLNYGNYGMFLIMGNAGFCPSAVRVPSKGFRAKFLQVSPERLPERALPVSGKSRSV